MEVGGVVECRFRELQAYVGEDFRFTENAPFVETHVLSLAIDAVLYIGITARDSRYLQGRDSGNAYPGMDCHSWGYCSRSGELVHDGCTIAFGPTFTRGDVIGFAALSSSKNKWSSRVKAKAPRWKSPPDANEARVTLVITKNGAIVFQEGWNPEFDDAKNNEVLYPMLAMSGIGAKISMSDPREFPIKHMLFRGVYFYSPHLEIYGISENVAVNRSYSLPHVGNVIWQKPLRRELNYFEIQVASFQDAHDIVIGFTKSVDIHVPVESGYFTFSKRVVNIARKGQPFNVHHEVIVGDRIGCGIYYERTESDRQTDSLAMSGSAKAGKINKRPGSTSNYKPGGLQPSKRATEEDVVRIKDNDAFFTLNSIVIGHTPLAQGVLWYPRVSLPSGASCILYRTSRTEVPQTCGEEIRARSDIFTLPGSVGGSLTKADVVKRFGHFLQMPNTQFDGVHMAISASRRPHASTSSGGNDDKKGRELPDADKNDDEEDDKADKDNGDGDNDEDWSPAIPRSRYTFKGGVLIMTPLSLESPYYEVNVPSTWAEATSFGLSLPHPNFVSMGNSPKEVGTWPNSIGLGALKFASAASPSGSAILYTGDSGCISHPCSLPPKSAARGPDEHVFRVTALFSPVDSRFSNVVHFYYNKYLIGEFALLTPEAGLCPCIVVNGNAGRSADCDVKPDDQESVNSTDIMNVGISLFPKSLGLFQDATNCESDCGTADTELSHVTARHRGTGGGDGDPARAA
eukprot:GEMP01001507.1.p1 GENE.GEMP01001507.1~~GEMP01001507.1.p1  ORF type:complete len:743 (+),score=137.14 GEMP01001507.1:1301-3529(+)